jgi:hypothetical protein
MNPSPATNLHAEACALVNAGISVIPASPATKQPDFALLPRDPETGKATWNPFRSCRATSEELAHWFDRRANRRATEAMAVVCGSISGGLVCLDFDALRLYEPWCVAAGDLARGLPVQKTGGGRRQVFFRCPQPCGNLELAWVEDDEKESGRSIGIETRGEGGYACVPPSLHPSGNRYEWISGSLTDVPLLSQAHAEALIAAARKLDECPHTRQQREQIEAEALRKHAQRAERQNGNDSDNVIGNFNQRHTVESLLESHGYTKAINGRYCRPDRDGVGSISIQDGRSVHFSTNDLLNDAAVGSGYGVHDAFDVFRMLEHSGDFNKAVRAAAESMGMSKRRTDAKPDGDARPKVFIPKGSVSIRESAATLGRLVAATERYYVWGGSVVTLDRDEDGGSVLTPVKTAALPSAFEEVAQPRTYTRIGDNVIEVDAVFSEQAAKLIVHAAPFRSALPYIRLLSRCPVLVERPNGTLVQVCGYDPESGVLADGPVTEDVSLDEAVPLLNDVLEGFDFATPSDRSRAMAALITPAMMFGRLLKDARTPIDLGEADQSQTGKGYRNKLTAALYRTGVKTVTQRRGGGVGSLEESFNSHLVRGASFVCLDNVRGKVDSPAIESFLTEESYFARVPFQDSIEVDPRRVVMQMTSNKADITVDLANRSSCVRLLKRPDGQPFRRYPEGDLLAHVRANQPKYLGAVFAVVHAWHGAGKPATDECRHSFRTWAQPMDWIVRHVLGAALLLDGHQEAQARMTSPSLNWLRDVALAVRHAGDLGRELRAHELLDILADHGGIEIPGLADDAGAYEEPGRSKALQALGRKLSACFKSKDEVQVEGWVVRRHSEYDQALRREARSYSFDPIGASGGVPEPSAPMREAKLPRIGAKPSPAVFGAPNRASEPVENGECAYDCAYGAPIADPRIGAARKAIPDKRLRTLEFTFAPNAPIGQEILGNTEEDTPSISTVWEPIGALGALGALGTTRLFKKPGPPRPPNGPSTSLLTPEQLEVWDERMAICLADGGMTEQQAEAVAWDQLRQEYGPPVGTGGEA